MVMIDELLNAVHQVECSIDRNEFSFLALTSKIEIPFRDRLAYALTSAAKVHGDRIAREYHRCDLAWLNDSEPKMLVELKACYLFNLTIKPVRVEDDYFNQVRSDIEKAKKLAGLGTSCFGLLLATHPKQEIPKPIWDTIKYSRDINSSMEKYGGAEGVRDQALAEIKKRLTEFSEVKDFRMELGSYLEIKTDLYGWILGK